MSISNMHKLMIYCVIIHQGAVVGALLGLGLNMVVIIGSTLEAPYREYLHISTANCSSLGYEEVKPMPQDP